MLNINSEGSPANSIRQLNYSKIGKPSKTKQVVSLYYKTATQPQKPKMKSISLSQNKASNLPPTLKK